MSRKSIEEDDQQQWLLAGTLNPTPEEHAHGDSEFPADLNNRKKCTTDWSVYLDNEDRHATERDKQQQHGCLLFTFSISIIESIIIEF